MDNNIFYDAIYKRKSIRKFDNSAIDKEVLSEISSFYSQLEPLYKDIKTEFRLAEQKDVKSIIKSTAPHFIIAFSEIKDGYLTNMGFMLEQLDLYFSIKGIGCCWQGALKLAGEDMSTNMQYVIGLAFGNPEEPLYRENVNQFKRKELSQICDVKDGETLLKPVRFAPSAINSQPWYFTGNTETIHVFCRKPNVITKMALEKNNQIDIGIAAYYLYLSAKHIGKSLRIITLDSSKIQVPKGYYYIASANLE
jgi:hypothetical protein